MSDTYKHPSILASILIWIPITVILGKSVVSFVSEFSLVDWIFDNYETEVAIAYVRITIYGVVAWALIISVWFSLLGITSLISGEYPPAKLPIPMGTKGLSGTEARKRALLLVFIAILGFMFSAVFVYSDVIFYEQGI